MMLKRAIFSSLVTLLCVAGTENISAQTSKGDVEKLTSRKVSKETIGAWAVQCSEVQGQNKRCSLAQRLIQAKTQRSIASWVISKNNDGKVMASVTVPAGVSVPAGLTMTIGKLKPQKLQYRTCLKSSCVAQFELTSVHLEAMSGGDKAVFTAAALSNRTLNIQFSLKGFSKAFKIYQSELG